MRNFGYLGLHSAIAPRSICPRDRVVDFTGDLQFRRRHLHEIYDTNEDDRRVCMASTWQKDYVSEPTVNGGRSFIGTEGSKDSTNSYSNTALYAQELAPLPLLITQPANQLPSFPGVISSSGSNDCLIFCSSSKHGTGSILSLHANGTSTLHKRKSRLEMGDFL